MTNNLMPHSPSAARVAAWATRVNREIATEGNRCPSPLSRRRTLRSWSTMTSLTIISESSCMVCFLSLGVNGD